MMGRDDRPAAAVSRRRLPGGALAGGAALVAGGAASPGRARAVGRVQGLRHLVWVWQFTTDADPNLIGVDLRDHGLGIVLKTHDGLEWMSKYDRSQFAVSGPAQVEVLSHYYEDAAIPFHAWCVVKGVDPIREAGMAAEVLRAGARSIFLDVEPHSGFWQGNAADALAFGAELRRLQPDAHVVLSVDPRPWVIDRIPLKEFVGFANEIAPQQYWRSFDTTPNYERYRQSGFDIAAKITPEFLNEISYKLLAGHGLPIAPVGQGADPDLAEWRRFIETAYSLGSYYVSVWRYGVTHRRLWPLLAELPARQPVPPPPPEIIHVVEPGDTLTAIAARYGTTVEEIVALNGLLDANFLVVGQELRIPAANGTTVTARAAISTAAPSSGAGPVASGRTHTVEPGDTLWAVALKYGVNIQDLIDLNHLENPDYLQVGQVLRIPR
jgi:LysM repeat protein